MVKKVLLSIIIVFLVILSLQIRKPEVVSAKQVEKEVWATAGDTSKEIQALLDYNRNDQYILTVRIPKGNYELVKEIRIYSNTTIIADKDARLIKNHQRGAMLANDLSNDKGGYLTTINIKVMGGIWDSTKISYEKKGTESFRFIHATNVIVKDATICNVPENSHLVTFAGVKNGVLDNCVLYGYIGTAEKEAVHLDIVHDNVMVPSMQEKDLIYDDLACDGITITNCEIYDYPRAIGSHTSIGGVYHKNITIDKNYIHGLDEAAIKAYNYVNLEISDNRIENVGLGILAYTYISEEKNHYKEALITTVKENEPEDYKIVISGNTIKDIFKVKSGATTKWGDAIRILGSPLRPITGVVVKQNAISEIKRYGMYINDAPKSQITSNVIQNTTKHAFYLDSGSNYSKIYYNKITNAGEVGSKEGGIGISKSNQVTVYKNSVRNAAKNGIFLYNQSTNCIIKNNQVTAAGDNAISINNKSNSAKIQDNIIKGNKIKGSNNRGIFVYDSSKASIIKNIITGCRVTQNVY